MLTDDTFKIAIQVNGKLRSEIEVEKDSPEEMIQSLAVEDEKVNKYIAGQEIKKVIYITGKVINIVV